MSTLTPAGQKLLQQVTTYKYFVAYFWSTATGTGYGMTEMSMSLPMRSLEDAVMVSDEIKRIHKIKGVVVLLNWILL